MASDGLESPGIAYLSILALFVLGSITALGRVIFGG